MRLELALIFAAVAGFLLLVTVLSILVMSSSKSSPQNTGQFIVPNVQVPGSTPIESHKPRNRTTWVLILLLVATVVIIITAIVLRGKVRVSLKPNEVSLEVSPVVDSGLGTPVQDAAKRGNVEAVAAPLVRGIDVNSTDGNVATDRQQSAD